MVVVVVVVVVVGMGVVRMLAAAPVAPPRLSDWSSVGQLQTEDSHWSTLGRVQTTNIAATPSPHQTPVQCNTQFLKPRKRYLPALWRGI